MPDQISIQRLKKRALERWENEGGRIYPDLDALEIRSLSPKRMDTDSVPAAIQRRTNNPREEKGREYARQQSHSK